MTEFDAGLLDPMTAAAGLVADRSVLAAMVDVEAAHLTALLGEPSERIVAAWRVAELDLAGLAGLAAAGGNPVIPLVGELRRRTPSDAAGWVHFGLTSQDVIDSALMLVTMRTVQAIRPLVAATVERLAALADRYRHVPAAGRTLGQLAAPTTAGLRLAVLLDGVARTWRQLETVETPLQLGGSVGTAAVLVDRFGEQRTVELRETVAARLGLTGRVGVWQVERSPVAAVGCALASFVAALGRLGLEVAQGVRTEVGELELTLPSGEGGSSAMPQKQNPVPAVLLVAAARRAPGLASTLLAAQLAGDDRPAGDWHAEWQPWRELLRLAVESSVAAERAVSAIAVDPDRMRQHLDAAGGSVHAERAQQLLVAELGRPRATGLIAAAMREDEFVPAIRAAAAAQPDVDEELLRRLVAVTTLEGAVGLSDRLIDAVIASVGEVSR